MVGPSRAIVHDFHQNTPSGDRRDPPFADRKQRIALRDPQRVQVVDEDEPLAQRGLKGGSPRRSPEGYFGRNRRKSVETAQPIRQKAVQGLLTRFRWSPTDWIFGRLELGSLGTFFRKSDLKIASVVFDLLMPHSEGTG